MPTDAIRTMKKTVVTIQADPLSNSKNELFFLGESEKNELFFLGESERSG